MDLTACPKKGTDTFKMYSLVKYDKLDDKRFIHTQISLEKYFKILRNYF